MNVVESRYAISSAITQLEASSAHVIQDIFLILMDSPARVCTLNGARSSQNYNSKAPINNIYIAASSVNLLLVLAEAFVKNVAIIIIKLF